MGDVDTDRDDGKAALVDAFAAFGGEALRDAWLFDQNDHESLYLRGDVDRRIDEIDVPVFVDNERYGYVTRQTYSDLYYADYAYTVRGFDEFEQFRTFLDDGDRRIGTFASFDRRDGGYDYARLQDSLSAVVDRHSIEAFTPNRQRGRQK